MKKTWHYVLTVEIPGYGMASLDNSFEAPEGATREQVYRGAVENILRSMAASQGLSRDQLPHPVTLFWSLESNDLDVATRAPYRQEPTRG
ncbi:hypothetical protein ACFQ7A_04870 [Streptomyces sp. NPDC056528]|uniref:hypothetical protein n=1 Tax=Streptomyces sp. NPDC056528 TaxID=3345854 RepID=UPI00367599D7